MTLGPPAANAKKAQAIAKKNLTKAPEPVTPDDYDRRWNAMIKRTQPTDRLPRDHVLVPGEFLLVRRDGDNLVGEVI